MTKESEKIIKKLNEMDEKFLELATVLESQILALYKILLDKGLLNEEQFEEHAKKCNKLLKYVDEYAAFIKMMRQIKKK